VRSIQNFVIEELSNWYVRNNRRRFWAKADDSSKMRSYLTLYHILEGICRLTAPVSPFISELLWKELAGQTAGKHGLPLSVHMCEFPVADESLIDSDLENRMDLAEKIVSLGRAARSRKNLKVRQPLSLLLVALPEGNAFQELDGFTDIIRDELNIKQISPAEEIDRYVSYSAKLNFKSAGPKLGSAVKNAAAFVSKLDSEAVKQFDESGQLLFREDGSQVTLTSDDIEVIRSERENYAVESGHGLMVALVTELSDELIDEGFAREIVNKVQNMRKRSGFEVTDRIQIEVCGSKRLREAAKKYDRFICTETLAVQLLFKDKTTLELATEWNINGEDATIALARV
jgi:isoleucyl-tRNA synthetase